ncbi:AP2/ERF domain-containing transcription factor [Hibiscus syriacus]|uniref:AP2/ERF domain-containing transcription factor n=1 Tax=Hibiscus syriacus TaxID=106335 RepID=A0A6A3C1K5_HIBSY|nr:AP2/ERF domain-containing transcription factor [Hibiscus syriacus]
MLLEKFEGKLKKQSDLDALSGKLDLNLRDIGLLIKIGVLGEATLSSVGSSSESETTARFHLKELLARLQIGNLEAKHKAVDSLVEVMKEDEKSVLSVMRRSNIAAIIQLLTSTSPCIQEKTATVICSLAESGSCESWLVSEGVLPPLIRLVESGSTVGREKATISLQRLSMTEETARAIAAAACTLKNISSVPEIRQILAEEGIIKVMINLLDCGILLGSKEYAAECLQNLTVSNENLRRSVISEGGIHSLLVYLDGPLPQESPVAALRNWVRSVSTEVLISSEMKKLVGEAGCITLLIRILEAKSNSAREVAAQALSSLVTISQNCREVKKDDKSVPNLVQSSHQILEANQQCERGSCSSPIKLSTISQNCREVKKDKIVPNLVQLLDPSPQNTVKKDAFQAYHLSCRVNSAKSS